MNEMLAFVSVFFISLGLGMLLGVGLVETRADWIISGEQYCIQDHNKLLQAKCWIPTEVSQ